MHTSRRRLTALVASLAALAVLAVTGAATASAAPAKFSANNMKITATSVSIRHGFEGVPVSCPLVFGLAEGKISGESTFWLTTQSHARVNFECPGGIFEMLFEGTASYSELAGYTVRFHREYEWPGSTPWGEYGQDSEPIAKWTNGSGSTQSTLFLNGTVGHLLGTAEPIIVNAKFTATDASGKLLTLSH